jgi:hypothetical protein
MRTPEEDMGLSYSRWCFERRVHQILRGWVLFTFTPNNRGLMHPDRDCENPSCPEHGTVHRHVPTLSDREEAYDYVTDWLELEYEREGERRDLAELNRMFALEDPRVSTASDLHAEAQRLIRDGQMPSLDELLQAVAKTRAKYRPQIIAARKRGRKRSDPLRRRHYRESAG